MNISIGMAVSVGFALISMAIGGALFFASRFTQMESQMQHIQTAINQSQAAIVDELGEEVKNSSFGLRTYLADQVRIDLLELRQAVENGQCQ